MEKIISHSDFKSKSAKAGKAYLLLYKSGSEQSVCAYNNLEAAADQANGINIYTADVETVKDIHPEYNISSVPSLLLFQNGNLTGIIKGCQGGGFYSSLFENRLYMTNSKGEDKSEKRVTVYSTPTCSWCNTLKAWLQKNNIRYTDIDISRDQAAAEALVRRSGQQGVPQTDINGEIIVGFNQPRLKELLQIQ